MAQEVRKNSRSVDVGRLVSFAERASPTKMLAVV